MSGFTVSALTDYVNQENTNLISPMHTVGETGKIMNIQSGIKSAEALQLLTVSPIPQVVAGCTFTPSGSTTFSQRTLTVRTVGFHDKYCLKALEAKWTQKLLKAGQGYTEADMPKQIVDEILLSIQSQIETIDWQGDTTSGSSYLNPYDGLLKIIDAEGTVVSATPSTWSVANSRVIIRDVISKIPAALKGNSAVTIFMGYPEFENYVEKLATDNLYHITGDTTAGAGYGTIRAENSIYNIKAVHGLDSTARIIAMIPENAFQGVDLENDMEKFELWQFTDGTGNIGLKVEFKRGWQIAKPAEIVEYTNS